MISFKQYITEAGGSAERQETSFVNSINLAVQMNDNKPIVLVSKKEKVSGVVKAEKYHGRQASGSEPYTDVQLFTGRGVLNLSMKGESAPSLAGGGLRGIENILPGLGARFFRAVYDHHVKTNKLKLGDKVPDVYGKLNKKDKDFLVIGNVPIGGPIDYMYIGPMDVKTNFKNGKLDVNGSLIKAQDFSDTHELYFRLRARRIDQTFDPSAVDSQNNPKIYGKSPSRGDSAGRLVITDKVPSRAQIIVF